MAKKKGKKSAPILQPHRGVFQAQGNRLQESENWAQSTALTIIEGRSLLDNLRNKLKPAQRIERLIYFQKWRRKIDKLHTDGGFDADKGGHYIKSEPPGASPEDPRVDLEIRKGIAFI